MLASPTTSRHEFGNIELNKIQLASLRAYNIHKLIYYEGLDSIVEAIAREKFIKGKSRKWKEALVQKMNPDWNDLTAVAQLL